MLDKHTQYQNSNESDIIMSAMRTGIFVFIATMETSYAVNWFVRDLLISKDFEPLQVVVFSELITLVLMVLTLIFLQKKIWKGIENKAISNFSIFLYCVFVIVLMAVFDKLYERWGFYIFSELNNWKLDRFYEFDCLTTPHWWLYNFFTHLKYLVFGLVFSLKRS